jgi:RND family efflux transporter MFP subunit
MKMWMSFCGVMLAALAIAGCSKAEGVAAKPPRPVKTHDAAETPTSGAIRYSATIEPYAQVSLAFKASGYVDGLLMRRGADGRTRVAQAGDRVETGHVLARVRASDYRERLTQGRARLSESEAGLVKARLDLDRAKTLFASNSLTKPDLDGAQASFDAAQARVAAAASDIELAAIALRDCDLVAPSAGVLLERKVEVGSLVSAGTVGYVLGDVTAVKARFGIPDSAIGLVAPGQSIDVIVDAAAPTAFAGRVSAVAPVADAQSRVFDIEITIPNKEGRLRPGMIGTVAIGPRDAAAAAPRLTVPLTAVVRAPQDGSPLSKDAQTYAVYVVERRGSDEIAKMRKVTLGDVISNGVAVLDGLAKGDQVIVAGATLLTEGERVRIVQ